MISKIIWQTYKEKIENIPNFIKECMLTWTTLNPTYTHAYMDDTQCSDFILQYFGEHIHKMYLNFPLAVMRADFWRYCVLYIHGGIYADVDTICKIPVDLWLNENYNFICSLEDNFLINNWTFASSKGNPILKDVINTIIQKNLEPNFHDRHFVHNLTGPTIWTEAILNHFGIEKKTNIQFYDFNNCKLFLCYNKNYSNLLRDGAVFHLFGSKVWTETYQSWVTESDNYLLYKTQMRCSQFGQDLDVLQHYNFKKNGYFVDIGAYDGKEISNTYLLEHAYNWKGFCFEPLPNEFELCKKNRPNSICINKVVFSESGKEFDFAVFEGLSGIKEYISTYKDILQTCPIIKVQSITLTDVLDENNAPTFIEYLTVDTEGSELEVLKGINFNKYSFGLIHIEHNFEEPKRTDIKTFLQSKGYKYKGENNVDDIFVLNKM